MTYFGDRLRELRQEQGLLQKDLADEFSVSLSMVSLWEKGKNYPEVTKLIEIAEYFKISVDALLGTDGNAKTPTSLPADVQNILNLYNSLSPERQREAAVWLKTLNELDSQTATASKKRKEIS